MESRRQSPYTMSTAVAFYMGGVDWIAVSNCLKVQT